MLYITIPQDEEFDWDKWVTEEYGQDSTGLARILSGNGCGRVRGHRYLDMHQRGSKGRGTHPYLRTHDSRKSKTRK